LVVISSRTGKTAKVEAHRMGCEFDVGWENIVKRKDIDTVLVCTPPNLHAEISIAAMEAGKNVLCEKPLARTIAEAQKMINTAKSNHVRLKCGFNHRHHPAVWKAKLLLDSAELGKPLFARCRYGYIGRPGYEKEWRADSAYVAGGQLMEQGIHVLDLFRWFLGDFDQVVCFTAKYGAPQPFEDNAFVLLRDQRGVIASLHSSMTQWRNLFNFEVFGQEGYVSVEGLGGSYGTEQLRWAKRDSIGPFREDVTDFRGEDRSWFEEWKEFVTSIKEDREPIGNGQDGLEALRLAFAAYESSKNDLIVNMKRGELVT
jgi:predicted dehydrogenase